MADASSIDWDALSREIFGIVVEEDCNFCSMSFQAKALLRTRDEALICGQCAKERNYCGLCGSVALTSDPESQLHYEELCLK